MPRRKTDTNAGAGKLPPDVKVTRKKAADGSVKVYYYRRSTGRRIEGEPGTVLFEQSWRAAGLPSEEEKNPSIPTRGEFSLLIDRFRNSHEGKRASKRSIDQRERYLIKIDNRFGHMTLEDLQDDRACEDFFDWRDEMAATPVSADMHTQTLGQLLRWAKARKIIKINQAEFIPRLVDKREARKRSRARLIFTLDKEKQIIEALTPIMRNAYYLALYLGARVGDLIRLRWDMIDADGWLIYTPSKTRNSTAIEVQIPTFALPPLKALLEQMPRHKHGYILSTKRGHRFTYNNFWQYWDQCRSKTSITLHWHDIRGTTITRLLSVGCTQPEVASITGHALDNPDIGTSQELARSLAKYGTINRDMALNAYRKWTADEFTSVSVDDNVVPMQRPKSVA